MSLLSLTWAAAIGTALVASGPDATSTMSRRLIALRAEVEDLYRELDAHNTEHRGRMSSLAMRRTELENAIRRQTLDHKRIQRELADNREQNRSATTDAEVLLPVIDKALLSLEARVKDTVPFKADERLASLKELRSRIERNDISAPRAIQRLWTFVEDELRLTKESGLFRQTVTVDGAEQLADVIRIGTAMLFYRTNNGAMGWATRSADSAGWVYQAAQDGDAMDQLEELFAVFEKQVRTGFFTIPNALPEAK